MKMKTCELVGTALNLAVELANGTHWSANGYFIYGGSLDPNARYTADVVDYQGDWAHGGPIIEREGIWPRRYEENLWIARLDSEEYWTEGVEGQTPLIAAMRAFVASRLGYEFEIQGNW